LNEEFFAPGKLSKDLADLQAGFGFNIDVARQRAILDRAALREQETRQLEDQLKVQEELARLEKDAAEAGLSEIDKKLRELQALGATAEQMAQAAKNLRDIADKKKVETRAKQEKETRDQLAEDARRFREELAGSTPLGKFIQDAEKLQQLFDAQKINQAEFDAGVSRLRTDTLSGAVGPAESIVAGSVEAFRAQFEQLQGGKTDELQLDELKRIRDLLEHPPQPDELDQLLSIG
jgi:hypothetical protein